MKQQISEIEINGVSYVRKDSINAESLAVDTDGLPCVIVGAGIGGIHFGFLKSRNGSEVTLVNARRIKEWWGAASITELATRGTSDPKQCKFSCAAVEIILPSAVEIISVTTKAQANLSAVPVWSK